MIDSSGHCKMFWELMSKILRITFCIYLKNYDQLDPNFCIYPNSSVVRLCVMSWLHQILKNKIKTKIIFKRFRFSVHKKLWWMHPSTHDSMALQGELQSLIGRGSSCIIQVIYSILNMMGYLVWDLIGHLVSDVKNTFRSLKYQFPNLHNTFVGICRTFVCIVSSTLGHLSTKTVLQGRLMKYFFKFSNT